MRLHRRCARGRAGSRGPDAPGRHRHRAQDLGQLAALPPDRARLLAGAAYVVSRAANADMAITADEVALMEQMLVDRLEISPRRRPVA